MYSSTPSFDSSFVLKFSGSSRTSPSRFPNMFVENQPFNPSILAFSIGPITVFTKVWPVLKSFPHIGTLWSRASFSRAVTSTVRLGAPFMNGTRSISAA